MRGCDAEDISADDETEAFISGLRDSVHAGMTCARIMAAFGLPGTVFTPADIADQLNDGDFGYGIDTATAVEMVKSSAEWTRLRESLTVAGHEAIERAVEHISVNG
ncbi:hypothetical protein SAMN04489752_2416 [Brevibacterium siliguriense]|uniref:Uncharacterized protein n=1 Tax=Brevibacterium siliguriense TaxID=1136497 RepID=A0A1H1UQR5_9MICO|nr:hypothetical protein [Brevibacterium siliguriense]SDS74904.1 hypothetical protein SAMN04489752_2416 [Brevibacterium siliguriense]